MSFLFKNIQPKLSFFSVVEEEKIAESLNTKVFADDEKRTLIAKDKIWKKFKEQLLNASTFTNTLTTFEQFFQPLGQVFSEINISMENLNAAWRLFLQEAQELSIKNFKISVNVCEESTNLHQKARVSITKQ